ncbi:MAG: CocE/NonD family hydrolase [Bryobacteraceae bacterium]|nr:CocE/NonD family hydrolase [Bryobacteraceae bacterium]MDW8379224.1 CocE/NonD family hydrolase [Bryobacterales bacterium]
MLRPWVVGLWICLGVVPQASSNSAVAEPLRIPMRDGVLLAAHLFRPTQAQRLPVLLLRTPYGKSRSLPPNLKPFFENGYAIVIQDVRGRYDSQGVFDPLGQEPQDGDDTLRWIAKQPWSNGNIGMLGGSYLGIVQWKAALTGNPHLKCIFPVVSGYDDYFDRFYSTGGAMRLGHRLMWLAANLRAPAYAPPNFWVYVTHLPLREADRLATGQGSELFQTALDHPSYDEFWKSVSTKQQLARINIPVFSVGGWYDTFVQSDLEAFAELRRLGREVHTMIGPWPHNMSAGFEKFDFGPESRAPISKYQMQWFDRHLRGRESPPLPPLRLFVMGVNKWREEQQWPLARAVPTAFYFHSRKGANSLAGDGRLMRRPPQRSHQDRFTYDPNNPVPTQGGATCCNPKVFPWGPQDQTPVENRRDVLVYTSPELDHDLEVTGPIKASLFVSTTARDTDFTAKLVDVYPDGRAINLTDGILRLRYRDSLEKPVLAEPGKIYPITIDVGVTSNVFRAGHRIRVEISSSNFPRFDRNLNTGGIHGSESTGRIAEQTLYLGPSHPSHILLPLIPQ